MYWVFRRSLSYQITTRSHSRRTLPSLWRRLFQTLLPRLWTCSRSSWSIHQSRESVQDRSEGTTMHMFSLAVKVNCQVVKVNCHHHLTVIEICGTLFSSGICAKTFNTIWMYLEIRKLPKETGIPGCQWYWVPQHIGWRCWSIDGLFVSCKYFALIRGLPLSP